MFENESMYGSNCGRKFQLLVKRLDQRKSVIRNINFWNLQQNFKFSRHICLTLLGTTILSIDMISCFLLAQSKLGNPFESDMVKTVQSLQVPVFILSTILFGWWTSSYFNRYKFIKIMLPVASLSPTAVMLSQISYVNENFQQSFFLLSIMFSSILFAMFPIVITTALDQIRIPEKMGTVRAFLFCLLQSWQISLMITNYNINEEPSNFVIYRFTFVWVNMLILIVLSCISQEIYCERIHTGILEKSAFFCLKILLGKRKKRNLHGRQISSQHSIIKDAAKRIRYILTIFMLHGVFSVMWNVIYFMTVHQAKLLNGFSTEFLGNTVQSLFFFIGVTTSEFILLPIFKYVGFNSEQKIIYLGYCFLFLSAISAILLQFHLQNRLDNFPKNDNAFLRVYNGLNSTVFITAERQNTAVILPHDLLTIKNIVGNESPVRRTFRFEGIEINRVMTLSATLGECYSVVISTKNINQLMFNDPVNTKVMTHDSSAQIFLVSALNEGVKGVVSFFCDSGKNYSIIYKRKYDFFSLLLDDEHCQINFTTDKHTFNVSNGADFRKGGIYSVFILDLKNAGISGKIFTLVEPFGISPSWLVPQVILLITAVSLTEISWVTIYFVESPPKLRSFAFSLWGLVYLTRIPYFQPDLNNLILIIAIDICSIFLFTLLHYRYRYIPVFQFHLSNLS